MQASAIPFTVMAFAGLILFHIRAFCYCKTIWSPRRDSRVGLPLSLALNCCLMWGILFLDPPVLLCFLILYLAVLLEFLYFFRGKLATFLFISGTFLFHIMDVRMIIHSIYVLFHGVSSREHFCALGLRIPSIAVTQLVLLALFEIFTRVVTRRMMQLLVQNISQLYFVTSSQLLINLYLLILSVSYRGQAYSFLAAVFLLSTGLLLFGAFYTSFNHAVRMSILLKYESRSHALEKQLELSRDSISALETFAFTDTLTEVHNRRFGMEALNRLLGRPERFCACFVDIDRLKEVNDRFGHGEGDQYILNVARVLAGVLPPSATLCRLGGDEFLVLLPLLGLSDAQALLARARESLRLLPSKYPQSISYGVREVNDPPSHTAQEVLRDADARMYDFKQTHRTGRPAR